MRNPRKVLALLLLVSVTLLPVAGLAAGFDVLKTLIEMPVSEDMKPAEGLSTYSDVSADTSQGVLCIVTYGENGNDSSMMISGINDDGKYEIRMYSDLDFMQIIYYSYLVSKSYSLVQEGLPSGEKYLIIVSLGEDNSFTIGNVNESALFADTVQNSITDLSNN